MNGKRIIIVLAVAAFLVNVIFTGSRQGFCLVSCSASSWPSVGDDVEVLEGKPYPFHRPAALSFIRAYQVLFSPTKGSFCPMHPHCSLYGYQSFKRYNPLKAFLMTADRLHRCGHDIGNYVPIEVGELVRFYDPLDLDSTYMVSGVREISRADMAPPISRGFDGHRDSVSTGDSLIEQLRLFTFANSLYQEGEYALAGTEFRRLLSYFPNTGYRKEALRGIFFCYYGDKRYLDSIHWGQDHLGELRGTAIEDEMKFYIAASYFRLGNNTLAVNYLNELVRNPGSAYMEKGILLKGLAHAHELSWDEAEESFSGIQKESEYWPNARQCLELTKEGKNIEYRNLFLAGIFSLVPGGGYLYDGYKQTALASFIVNSLFFWGTIEAFREDNQGLGTMLSVLSFGWYAGNVYGGVLSARRKNMKLENDLLLKFDIGYRF